MSIKDSITEAKEGTYPKGVVFKAFYAWYEALPEEDSKAIDAALISGDVSIKKLFYSLKVNEGVTWGEGALYFHASRLKQEK